jgi:D-glycero-alpha-D-manno-heptose-7-phosphate kinase
MLIARAPLRISLAGGGTDLPAYFDQYGGVVVSLTIDKHVYVTITSDDHDSVQITSADYRTFYRHLNGTAMNWDGDLALPRAVLHEFNLEHGISVFIASEVPPGTGLGSSGALAVALVQAVSAYLNRAPSLADIAELACHVELQKLRAPVGKQDQFAAAFGGLNVITFTSEGVTVSPLQLPPSTVWQLERRLLLFFTGTARDSATILKAQQHSTRIGDGATLQALHRIRDAAQACRACLEAGDLDGVGTLLNEGWDQKKRLAPGITNSWINELYEAAVESGARGGKITGAGGGGFLLLYCDEAVQDRVTETMENRGLRRMNFRLSAHGVAVASVQWNAESPVTSPWFQADPGFRTIMS